MLVGIETEYGLWIEGRGAEDQLDDAAEFVRAHPGPSFDGWDYADETPRADLRGFTERALKRDPRDAEFDRGRVSRSERELRSDRILPNGARFYNDHGHPEYATPECTSIADLASQDLAGEEVLRQAAEAYAKATGREVKTYKNNTDFHGAAYGTHENYLVPRILGFDAVYKAVMPILIARQVLCGAGKVGSETSKPCGYQLSQRADFIVERIGVDTLYRRPLFNTRDEPHADPNQWIRLHVICGDANMISSATARKVALVQMALELAERGAAETWTIANPPDAFQSVSRDESRAFRISLGGSNWTTAYEILEATLCAFDGLPDDKPHYAELRAIGRECEQLMSAVKNRTGEENKYVDWAAKRAMIGQFIEAEGGSMAEMSAFDLAYHDLDPSEGLYFALLQEGMVTPRPIPAISALNTRARARGIAADQFKDQLLGANWGSLTFRGGEDVVRVPLDVDKTYDAKLAEASSVENFIAMLRGER